MLRSALAKILSPLILLPVLLPAMVVLIISIKRENTRHEIKERLEEGLLHTIQVKNDSYQWIKPGKEILVEGRMFDIKTYTVNGNETTFTGLFDEEETELNGIADNLLRKQSQKRNMLLTQLLQLMQGIFFQAADDPAPGLQEQQFLLAAGTETLPVIYNPIITPPPQL